MRKYLIAGLLVWIPLGITFLVIRAIVGLLDRILLLLPEVYQPENMLGIHIPGLGVLLAIILVLATGMIVANLLGKRLIFTWEKFLARIPLVRSLYAGIKQIMEAILSTEAKSFRKVLLIEYPRKGLWSLAFMTSEALGEVQAKTTRMWLVCLFQPRQIQHQALSLWYRKQKLLSLIWLWRMGLK